MCSSTINNGHKNPNISHNHHDKNHDELELYQGNGKRSFYNTQQQNNAHPKTYSLRLGAAD